MGPLEQFCISRQISPNWITLSATALCVLVFLRYAGGHVMTAGWLVLLVGSLDVLDGRVARASNRVTIQGGFLDSVMDRYQDFLLFAGLAVCYRDSWVLYLVLLAMAGAVFVPYVRAKADSIGIDLSNVGTMQRPERFFLLGFGSIVSSIFQISLMPMPMYGRGNPPPQHLLISCAFDSRGYYELDRLSANPAHDGAFGRERRSDMKLQRWIGMMSLLLVISACGGKAVTPLKEAPKKPSEVPTKATVIPTPTLTATPSPSPAEAKPIKIESTDSPLVVIQKYTEQLRVMVGLSERQQKGIKDEAKERQVQTTVREFFDFPTLARFSLGNHWKTRTPEQQAEYSKLFIDLVEESYIRRSRDLVGHYDLTFTGEKVQGSRARVNCRVARNDADIDILYELHKVIDKWMIFNIVLDNVDLIKNYQSQFNSIILKYGWNDLIQRMQKKLDVGEEETDI